MCYADVINYVNREKIMVRRKQAESEAPESEEVLNDTLEAETDYQDDPPSEGEQRIEELITDLGGAENAEIKVYSAPKGNASSMAWLFTCGPQDYSLGELLQKIKDEYGGGDYRIHIRQNNRILANRKISIAEPKKSDHAGTEEKYKYQMELERERQKNADDRFSMILQQMQDQQKTTMEMFKTVMQGNQQNQRDPMEMLTGMMGAIAQMQKLAGADKQTDPYKEVEKLLQLRDRLTGETSDREPSSGDILLKAINQFGPLFGQAMQSHQGASPQTPPAAPQNPGQLAPPQPNPPNDDQPPSTETVGQSTAENAPALIQHLQVLMLAAERDGDPGTYADMVLDFTDENSLPQLAAFVSDENCIGVIAQYYPPLEPQRLWFEELRTKLVEAIRENYPALLQPGDDGIKGQDSDDMGAHDPDHGDTPGNTERQAGDAGNPA